MYAVNGLPSTVTSTRRFVSSGTTLTSAAPATPAPINTRTATPAVEFFISGPPGTSRERGGIHSRGASGGSGGRAASAPQLNSDRKPQLLQIRLADLARLLRRAPLVGHRVQLHDRPALEARLPERGEDPR